MQIIIFTLGEKFYALDTQYVKEISVKVDTTYIPNTLEWINGLINLRGNVIPLVNLFKLLDQDGDLCYNNVIFVKYQEDDMGLMVSNVVKVVNIDEEEIQDSSIIIMDEMVIDLIDLGKLISKK